MAESFLDLVRQRFPQAEELASQRIFARGHTIFFDKKTGRKLLPQFTPDLVFAALYLAKYYIAQAGGILVLTKAEENLFRGYLVPPVIRQ